MSATRMALVLVAGEGVPRRLSLLSRPVLLGRDLSCDLVIEDPRVSSRHARLSPDGETWSLEDLGSSNGTLVNDVEVTRTLLRPGDRIRIGDSEMALEEEGGSTVPPTPVVDEPAAPRRSPATAPTPARPAPAPERPPPRRGQAWTRAAPRLLETLASLLGGEPSGDPGALLGQLLESLLEAFEADRGALFVPVASGEDLELLQQRLGEGDAGDGERPISRSMIRRVAEEGDVVLLTSAQTEELRSEIVSIAGELRSLMAAPIPLPEGPGVLYLESVLERRRFQERDGDLLRTFARAAGEAMSRDRDRLEAARRSERLLELQRRDLARAEIVGESGPMRAVLAEVAKAAGADVSVLVTGESGTGKELVARALHRASSRASRAFVPVNCAALPAELVESELFGHEKGAFTGAESQRLGQFELADGGTLFLDEVGELPLPAQGKLLRALQERRIQRVGGGASVPVDFRLVCATNVRLEEAVAEGRFREDLFYRIAVFRIPLPPLRGRGEDVLLLAEHFRALFAREFRRPVSSISDAAARLLVEHDWPGNIRELRNVIEQAVVREERDSVTARSVMPALGLDPTTTLPGGAVEGGGEGSDLRAYPVELEEARRLFERRFLELRIGEQKGNMKATAEAIGLSRKALYLKCDEYGIDYKKFR